MRGQWPADEKSFRDRVVEGLAGVRVDFSDEMRFIREQRSRNQGWASSGVLIPLEFDRSRGEPVIVLNKRSTWVLQPGDLCCPGGGMDRKNDRILGFLLSSRLFPMARSQPFRRLLALRGTEKEILLTILAGVLRESWEEMRLPPWKVEYLGALPAHRMMNFPRTIFPLVGRIRGPWRALPNWEVEKILRVPVRSFFSPENYAICRMRIQGAPQDGDEMAFWELPCLVVQNAGAEEILWGATFKILLNFLEEALDLSVSDIRPERVVAKELPAHYYTGKTRERKASRTR